MSWTVILIIMVGATCSAFLIAFVVCLFTLRKKWRRENQRMSDIVEIQSTGMKNTSWNGHLDHKYGSETGRPALGLTTSAGCERSISSGFDVRSKYSKWFPQFLVPLEERKNQIICWNPRAILVWSTRANATFMSHLGGQNKAVVRSFQQRCGPLKEKKKNFDRVPTLCFWQKADASTKREKRWVYDVYQFCFKR